jgi:thiamine-phosphate pyrophosphorylase
LAAGRETQDDPRQPCRLYLITPPALDAAPFAETLKAALDAGDVACVQLRLKGVTDDHILRTADVLMPIVQRAGTAFILNDRPDLAQALGADGVHVGQEDMPYAKARQIVGPDAIVGVTCHASRHLAMEAGEAGADYVAFGAFFPTATKDAPTRADVELIEDWTMATTVPCVAIGGITADNCGGIVRAGADFIAVSGAVWNDADGPAAAVKKLNDAIRAAR